MTDLPARKTNRLKEFDYSSNGAYFITICVKDKKCILSSVIENDDSPQIKLKEFGMIADRNIEVMRDKYRDLDIVRYVIMPNHIHLLISINNETRTDGAPRSSPPTNRLSAFVSAFKKYTGNEIGFNIWQRSFHDHVIRDDDDFLVRWQYIEENPKKWLMGKDEYYA